MTVNPTDHKLGWIGTGVMGASMAGHLRAAGFSLTVTTRSRERAAELEAAGATWADTPAEVAAASDVTFAIVGFPADVREVFLGDSGALAGATSGSTLVDMTTSEPSLAVEIAAAASAKGVGAPSGKRRRNRMACDMRLKRTLFCRPSLLLLGLNQKCKLAAFRSG